MFELADGIYQLSGKPPNMIIIYLIDGILVDAGTPQAHKRIFRELGDRVPTAHLVTPTALSSRSGRWISRTPVTTEIAGC